MLLFSQMENQRQVYIGNICLPLHPSGTNLRYHSNYTLKAEHQALVDYLWNARDIPGKSKNKAITINTLCYYFNYQNATIDMCKHCNTMTRTIKSLNENMGKMKNKIQELELEVQKKSRQLVLIAEKEVKGKEIETSNNYEPLETQDDKEVIKMIREKGECSGSKNEDEFFNSGDYYEKLISRFSLFTTQSLEPLGVDTSKIILDKKKEQLLAEPYRIQSKIRLHALDQVRTTGITFHTMYPRWYFLNEINFFEIYGVAYNLYHGGINKWYYNNFNKIMDHGFLNCVWGPVDNIKQFDLGKSIFK